MKKIMRATVCAIMLAVVLLPCFSAYAEDDVPVYDYYIKNYDVNIDVGEDNTLHITESIDAKFNIEKHGIYRYIPTNFYINRADGSSEYAIIKLRNIDCSDPYEKYTEGNNTVLQIGDEDNTYTGDKSYKISYDYSIGPDTVKNADELYYNIIGDGWDTVIQNVTFSIKMPKNFDESKIGFSSGTYGTEGTDIVKFSVKDNVISGKTTAPLNENEALTIRIELEDNYFTFDWTGQYIMYGLMVAVPLLLLILTIIVWYKHGRDKKPVETIEFYPPENMSCVDVSYWENGKVTNEDVVPLLIELANEGYVEIDEKDKKNTVIKKIKSYNGKDGAKSIFMSGLFSGRGNEVTLKELKRDFYPYIERIVNKYRSPSGSKHDEVFTSKSILLRLLCWFGAALSVAFVLFLQNRAYHIENGEVFVIAGIIISVIAAIMACFVRKRSDKGVEILGKIKGFKTFLETAEKDRLEALVEENPSYFYDILPYAYVLGVSDKWTKKFESIAMEPPRWYYGYNPYSSMWAYSFMHGSFRDMNRIMITPPEHNNSTGGFSGGSFGGGGGFSGGGFGGGGGGSW